MIKDGYYYPITELKNGWTLEIWPGISNNGRYGSEEFDYHCGILTREKDQPFIDQCEKVLPELAKIVNDWLLPNNDFRFYLEGDREPYIINNKHTRFMPEEKKVILAVGSNNFDKF